MGGDEPASSWRIIPISKWLGSPPFTRHLDHLEGQAHNPDS